MSKDKKFGEVSDEDIQQAKEAAPEDLKEKTAEKTIDCIMEWLESFAFAIFLVILVFTFFLRVVVVDGGSMNDTLEDGDRMILSHGFNNYDRGDIVVINSEVLNKTIIKRVIGVEGDHVKIDYTSNTVYVNDEMLDEGGYINVAMYDNGMFNTSYRTSDGIYEYDVPEDCIFVMGDNRNDSKDSRSIGFVPEDTVLGEVSLRMFPMDKFGFVE